MGVQGDMMHKKTKHDDYTWKLWQKTASKVCVLSFVSVQTTSDMSCLLRNL